MAETEKVDSHKIVIKKEQGLSDTFNLFSKNKYFIQDVGNILSVQKI